MGALLLPTFLTLLLLSSIGLQFTSTILLSDLQLKSLPGFDQTDHFPLDFKYDCIPSGDNCREVWFNQIPRGSTWVMNPPSYAAFSEYTEPMKNTNGDVDDTGLTLRAFLPMSDAESRQNLRNHTGLALVIDSRVSCQAPDFQHLSRNALLYGNISGVVANSVDAPDLQQILPTAFECTFAGFGQMSLCQIGNEYPYSYIGSLDSQLSDYDRNASFGTAFLLINPTDQPQSSETANSSVVWLNSTSSVKRGSWTNLSNQSSSSVLSISLCFAPWDAARLDINMYSARNRTEPIPRWLPPSNTYDVGAFDMSAVISQLGLSPNTTSAEDRGILTLEKPESSIARASGARPMLQRPFIRADMAGTGGSTSGSNFPLRGNYTTFLTVHTLSDLLTNFTYTPSDMLAADPAISGLFKSAFQASNGSAAHALASVITVLSATAYYGQFPAFDYVPEGGVRQVYFRPVLVPVQARGFSAVVWVLTAHTALVSAIMVIYTRKTRVSLLGEAWASVAQVQSLVQSIESIGVKEGEAQSNPTVVGTMTDKSIKTTLEKEGKRDLKVRLLAKKTGIGKITIKIRSVQ